MARAVDFRRDGDTANEGVLLQILKLGLAVGPVLGGKARENRAVEAKTPVVVELQLKIVELVPSQIAYELLEPADGNEPGRDVQHEAAFRILRIVPGLAEGQEMRLAGDEHLQQASAA